ncbi:MULTISPECIES: PadR family transcriptional regulator [Enterovibrio]|uniref:Transcriptional regulator n=2 Tax=Enterovibrio norvegicus TaxID=188144 RepID=A0A2N7LE65_9GAMM|nr:MULTISPECIES: PadR family transcriptional regulator [Enterovibrio]MBE1275970.1 PadR family transcriptional regulator [Enterovibrio baiacu]MCC4800167.1 PadR family transcriptional regulator [Enterovibrio norvegicus]OEE45701.1 transcriptional regulator [Enterovibrio norvegicus]OEF53350.1 transcriptional regulator [Enterovibrio norvegicus]OEF63057.1 transcriptional regulator [Enterovibrio norvegicus]
MSLPHVILTVLSHRDATGYDITKEFSNAIGQFWKASHQQVYRELNKLADMGAVSCKLEPQDGKPDRKVYSITDIGRQSLYEWFLLPAKHPTDRDEVSAKLLTCSLFEPAPMIQHMHALIDESRLQLSQYRDLEKNHYADSALLTRDGRLERLTLRRNILRKEAWLTWAEEVLIELNAMEASVLEPKLAMR